MPHRRRCRSWDGSSTTYRRRRPHRWTPTSASSLRENVPLRAQVQLLIRGMLRQALQVLAGSEIAIADTVAKLLIERVPGTPGEALEAAGGLVLWALAYGEMDRHTGMLLVMGRDAVRGRLDYVDDRSGTGGRTLVARLGGRLLDTSSAMQERVLRDIARAGWQGELRTNPASTMFGKRLTVHSHGGCPMGTSPDTSVTDSLGRVHGSPGLYVMDAAAFPASVGVNPSATIAAVAEYKIEKFIQQERPGWRAHEDLAGAGDWFLRHGRNTLDPLNAPGSAASAEPQSKVIGLTFEETMTGFVVDMDSVATDMDSVATDWEDLQGFPSRIPSFTDAADRGSRSGSTIEACLKATVDDLSRLVSTETRAVPLKVGLTGDVKIGDESFLLSAPESYMQLFVRSREDKRPTRFFRYELHWRDGEDAVRLRGLKVLREARGVDVWNGVSVTYFEIVGSEPPRRGIMQVSLDSFLKKQLYGMQITGTDDAARKSWGLMAFYKYFAAELFAVYQRRAMLFLEPLKHLFTDIHV